MPPGEYNPNNAGIFEAVKIPEQQKGPEKKGPNYEKLAELKRAAAEARGIREASVRAAEQPLVDAARITAQELAVSGTPNNSFTELSRADKTQLAKEIMKANAEILEGRRSVDQGSANANVDADAFGSEKDYARQMPAITREQIRAYQDAQMVEVSPLSKNGGGDTMKIDQPRAQAPQPRKKFLGFF